MKAIKRLLKLLILLMVIAGIGLFYIFKIEPYRLVVRHEIIEADHITTPIKLVQVSDIQISENYTVDELKKIVNLINEQNADIVLFTGDLYENFSTYGPVEETIEILSQLRSNYGVYAVYGNRDIGGGARLQYRDILESSNTTLLMNSGVTLNVNGNQLFIGGLHDALLGTPDIDTLMQYKNEPVDYSILLTHEGDVADDYTDKGFDVIFAGHSHGGQVKLPFIDVLTSDLGEKYTKGEYTLANNTKLFVSSGIGTSHIAARFMVPPEIVVFDLQ